MIIGREQQHHLMTFTLNYYISKQYLFIVYWRHKGSHFYSAQINVTSQQSGMNWLYDFFYSLLALLCELWLRCKDYKQISLGLFLSLLWPIVHLVKMQCMNIICFMNKELIIMLFVVIFGKYSGRRPYLTIKFWFFKLGILNKKRKQYFFKKIICGKVLTNMCFWPC